MGLFYNYFRFYDPATGRYIENDPIDLQGGLNRYGYVNGNPLHNIDPTGEMAMLAHPAVTSLVVNTIGIISVLIVDKIIDDNIETKVEEDECNDKCDKTIYYKYLNLRDYQATISAGYTIKANSRGQTYLTKFPMSPEEAKYNLFMGGYGDYAGKGEYVISFQFKCGVSAHLVAGTQPNEWIYPGSLRLGRQIETIIYHGPNPY